MSSVDTGEAFVATVVWLLFYALPYETLSFVEAAKARLRPSAVRPRHVVGAAGYGFGHGLVAAPLVVAALSNDGLPYLYRVNLCFGRLLAQDPFTTALSTFVVVTVSLICAAREARAFRSSPQRAERRALAEPRR